ncbi:MAG TPA: sugar phosphate isomerase/epimerase [Methanocella sp.]|nr:sugar phosphate isomerase/epimerase [Methanocella sp.]
MAIIGNSIDESRVNGRVDKMEADLRHFEEVGLRAAEILPHGIDAIRNGRVDEKTAKRAADICGGFDLQYSVHVPNPVNIMHGKNPQMHKKVLRASLEFAEAIGAGIFVYHPGRYLDEEEFSLGLAAVPEDRRGQLLQDEADHLRDLADEFKGIKICMENASPYLGSSPFCYAEQIPPLRDQVLRVSRSNVKITLDIGHLYMASKLYRFDPVEAVKYIAPLIAHTHAHDNFGRLKYHFQKQDSHLIPFGMGDAHMPVGWGEIPLQNVLGIYASSYKGMYIMELKSRYYDDIGESKDNLSAILSGLEAC